MADLGLRDRAGLRRQLSRTAAPEEYLRGFFGRQRDLLRPRRYLLEKSPRNVHHVDRIRAIFPAARLIAIYRDGRDVVTSDRFFTRDHRGQEFDFAAAAADWRSDMEAQLHHAERHQLFTCSYENLLADGAGVARRLFAFLDLPHGEPLIADVVERSSFRFHAGRERGHENRRSFIAKAWSGIGGTISATPKSGYSRRSPASCWCDCATNPTSAGRGGGRVPPRGSAVGSAYGAPSTQPHRLFDRPPRL